MNRGCLPEINVRLAIEKGLCQAGTGRLGVSSDRYFEQALLPKPGILLPAASTAPSLLCAGTSLWVATVGNAWKISQHRKQTGLGAVPRSGSPLSCTRLLLPSQEKQGGAARSQGQRKGTHIFPWHCQAPELAGSPEGRQSHAG